MGFWGAVCSVGSAIVGALSSAASFIGGAIGSGLSTLSNIVNIALNPKELIQTIANIVVTIAEVLGIIKKEESVEELGAKALETDKKPEDFDSIEEYIDHLRNEISIDKAKLESMSESDRLTCTAVGSIILAKGISEKKGIEVDTDFLAEVAKMKMEAKEVEAYIDNFKAKDLELRLTDYLNGKLSVSENLEIKSVLKDTIQQLNPEMSKVQIDDKILEMKQISLEK